MTIHIYAGTHEWDETYVTTGPDGEPIQEGYRIAVEEAFCGVSDYPHVLQFAWDDPEDCTCEVCYEEYAMHMLATIGDRK